MVDGQPVEIKRSNTLDVKLTKAEKIKLREMRKRRSGSLQIEIVDPYKDFKDKIKQQIQGDEK
jgi:hypothetical protein